MSFFYHEGHRIFYTEEGTGKPFLILNGIMMSTKSWQPFAGSFSERNRFIRLDFLDQGQSDRLPGETYTHAVQVELIKALADHLGIEKLSLVGISYGGEIALQAALRYPDLVDRLVLFNTTAFTGPWIHDIGRAWIAAGRTRDGLHYYRTTIPVIYSPHYYQSRIEWMKRRESLLVPIFSDPVFLDAMERLTLSSESFDVRDRLSLVKAKTLLVSAEEDYLTPVAEQEFLWKNIPGAELVKIPGSGHASMYERPLLFTTLVLGFLNVKDLEYAI